MKLFVLKCPECGASLDIPEDRKQFYCSYCGNKILLDDGSRTVTHIHVNKTREKELILEEKKIIQKQKSNSTKERETLISCSSIVIAVISIVVAFLIVKDDFNIMFNFCFFLVGFSTGLFRFLKKRSTLGIMLLSSIITATSVLFIALRNDFDTTFTIALAITVVVHMAANFYNKRS